MLWSNWRGPCASLSLDVYSIQSVGYDSYKRDYCRGDVVAGVSAHMQHGYLGYPTEDASYSGNGGDGIGTHGLNHCILH